MFTAGASSHGSELQSDWSENPSRHERLDWGQATPGMASGGTIPNQALSLDKGCCNGFRDREQLLNVYLARVDPIVKIIHRPSLQAYMRGVGSYLDYGPSNPAPVALASAICYAASCTLNQEACVSIFAMDKESLIAKHQKDTQYALERADYMLTNDITVLQAFVISLIAMRSHDHSRRFWTMVAVALRIAQALSLHDPNPPFSVKPFDREMRRRLWHAIGWLDIQAALSSSSESMLPSSWLCFQPFLDLDDDEFSTDFEKKLFPSTGISDTSLFIVLSSAQETARYLIVSHSAPLCTRDAREREKLAFAFQKRTDELVKGLQPDRIDFHWYLKTLAHSIAVFLRLLALRPLDKNLSVDNCQVTGVSILKLAVEALDSRYRVYSSTKTQLWQWARHLFFPWQALVIALSEVRVCHDFLLVQSIWPLIERSYQEFVSLAISPPQSRLPQSMTSLMERARRSYDSMVLPSLSNDPNKSPTLSWGFLRPATPQRITTHAQPSQELLTEHGKSITPTGSRELYATASQENDMTAWAGGCELDKINLAPLESALRFEHDVDSRDILFQALGEYSSEIFLP
ncbi:Acetamidase regulatory protein [Talaromyces islandicus]|uniref:Acetamidase regulatory protein n=1 Tax=Talaromyces islandicus TaxID=28573 RepID=A0A0U1LXX6_TALIS|nr:Acetamidase regulatory protein [Talaromyces islandicus]